MDYQKKTWQSGEVITSAALNNIETGIDNLVQQNNNMVYHFTSNQLKIGSAENDTLIEGSGGNLKVDKKITAGELEVEGDTTFLANTAVTVNGTISVQTPTANAHAATKKYVDDSIIALKAIQITAGDGLNGGGALSTNPSISLKAATSSVFGGVTVGKGLQINTEDGKLDVIAIQPADKDNNGLMTAAQFTKLESLTAGANGTVTGIQLHGNTISPSGGVVNLGSGLVTGIKLYSSTTTFTPPADGSNADGTVTLRGVVTGIKVDNDTIISAPTEAPEGNGEDSGVINISSVLSNKLDIPALPDNNGTYTLQLTLNNGTATYEWVASGGEGT